MLQRDLHDAKARVDDELNQFQVIQQFIEKSLSGRGEENFFDLTVEAVIEAFELEVALVLLPGAAEDTLSVAGSFGFDEPPAALPFDPLWIEGGAARIVAREHPLLAAWPSLALQEAIICPLRDGDDRPAGLIVGGLTVENHELYEAISASKCAAFTVMVRQAGSVLNHRTLNLELAQQNARLEVEHGRQLVLQRDLIRAKDRVDDELMRFKSIQGYIASALEVGSDEDFFELTLESVIEAFELETAMFLRAVDDASGCLQVVSHFGFEEVPETLPFATDWFEGPDSRIVDSGSEMLARWPDLNLATAILCPFRDRDERLAGVILAGVTADSMDFYETIREEVRVPFSVMVRQAGGLWINRQLNAEVLAQNRQLASLTESYSRFVPFQFLDLLGQSSIEDISTGDSALRDMSVLFADIRGFTTLAEQLGPTAIFVDLNEFLAVMEPLIEAENGFINQYLGDAIMALFPGSADAALRCAAAMMETQLEFNYRREREGKAPIFFGLGINSGPLMIGALGGGKRLDSNVIGDTANLASRAEGLTKVYGVQAIFTEATRELLQAPADPSFREIDRVVVKGRAEASTIFELFRPAQAAHRAGPAQFDRALRCYRDGDFAAARVAFLECASTAPEDPVPALYLRRCEMLQNDPPPSWDGVWVLEDKQ